MPTPDESDIENLATMINMLLGPMSDDVPRERLEGLARELAEQGSDDSYDTFAMIERWVGAYLD